MNTALVAVWFLAPPTRQDFLASFTSPRVHSTCLHMRNEWQKRFAGHGACHARIAILRADRRGANSCESFIHGGIDFIFATPLQVDGSCENAEHDLQQNMRSFEDIHWQLHDRSEAGCCASFWLQQAKPSTNQVHTNTSDLDELHDGPKRWKRSTVGANLALSWHVTVACAKSCGWQCEFCKHESIKRKKRSVQSPCNIQWQ